MSDLEDLTGNPATYAEYFSTTDLSAFVDEYGPGNASIRLDYEDLAAFDDHLAHTLRKNPDRGREHATEAVRAYLDTEYEWKAGRINIRVRNLPERHVFRVGKQRTRHLGQLIGLEAEVVETDSVKPFAENAAFECLRCGTCTRMPQRPGKMFDPASCPACEDSRTFKFNRQQSTMVDHQRVIVIPPNSTLEEPPGLIVFLRDDLCDTVEDGDQVAFTGRLDTFYQQKESVLSTYLLAFDLNEEEYAEVDADPDDITDLVTDYVRENEREGTYGVPRRDVVEAIAGDRFREREVEEAITDLCESSTSDVQEVMDKLAVASTSGLDAGAEDADL